MWISTLELSEAGDFALECCHLFFHDDFLARQHEQLSKALKLSDPAEALMRRK